MYNRSILVGRLTRQPELRYTASGVAVTSFTIAVDKPFKKEGANKAEADFFPIVTWRGLAEIVASKLDKGRLVLCEGRLERRSYEKDNVTVWVTELIADDVRFLDWPADDKKDTNTQAPPPSGSTPPSQPPNWYNSGENYLPY